MNCCRLLSSVNFWPAFLRRYVTKSSSVITPVCCARRRGGGGKRNERAMKNDVRARERYVKERVRGLWERKAHTGRCSGCDTSRPARLRPLDHPAGPSGRPPRAPVEPHYAFPTTLPTTLRADTTLGNHARGGAAGARKDVNDTSRPARAHHPPPTTAWLESSAARTS